MLYRENGVRVLDATRGDAHVLAAIEKGRNRYIVGGIYLPPRMQDLPFATWFESLMD